MRRIAQICAAIVGALLLAVAPAKGAVLLGTFQGGGTMGHSGMPTPHGLIVEQMFLLSYVGLAVNLEDPVNNPYCIGCSSYVPVGWTGTKTFDYSTDAQQFQNFLGILTNASDESILVGGIYRDSSTVLGGGFGDAYESQLLGQPQTLTGWQVEHVVLTVLFNEVLVNTTDSFTALPLTRWEFWGMANPVPPSAAPEPGTLALLGLGLAGLAAKRRR